METFDHPQFIGNHALSATVTRSKQGSVVNVRLISSLISAVVLTAVPALVFCPGIAQAQGILGIQVQIAPPALPIYQQPPLPAPNDVWIPGYWSWDDDYGDYFWVPGTWVQAPTPGYLWTPAWWGWDNGLYVFHNGYWGRQVGFYGGVDYGFGYNGVGYEGGYWNGDRFFYNTAVNRVNNANITNVYQKAVNVDHTSHVSFNGGPGGVRDQPTPAQAAAAREPHLPPTTAQTQHVQVAHNDRSLYATANHGAPPVAASAEPGRLSGPGVVRANSAGGPLPPALSRGPVGAHAADPGAHSAAAAPRSVAPGPRPAAEPALQRPSAPPQRSAPKADGGPAGAEPKAEFRPAPPPHASERPPAARPPAPFPARPAQPPKAAQRSPQEQKAPPRPPEEHRDEPKQR
jgi:hypothetical protein